MTHTCKNCGNIFEGNYCNNCGQPADTHPINAAFVAHDLQHGLMHIDGGIFYSARELFKRPGHAARDYIQGKRIKHYKPLSMVLVISGLYALIYHALDIDMFRGKADDVFNYKEINDWIIHHFPLITLAGIPLLSLSSYIMYRKQGFNFIEHIILNSFYSTQKLWIRLLTLPLLWAATDYSKISGVLHALLAVDFVLMLWCYAEFFNNLSKAKAILSAMVTYVLYLLFTIIVCTILLTILLSNNIINVAE